IDLAFVRLQVIALVQHLVGVAMIFRRDQRLVEREHRRLARTHVSENNSAQLFAGIRAMANLVLEVAALGLGRLLQTSPVHAIKPAVIETAQAAVFEPAEAKIGAAVRAAPS